MLPCPSSFAANLYYVFTPPCFTPSFTEAIVFIAIYHATLTAIPSQVNAARTTRRRTYHAHGRINAYVCTPSNIEIIATQKAEQVPKAAGGKSAASSRLGEGASA